MRPFRHVFFITALFSLASCGADGPQSPAQFQLLRKERTGLDFKIDLVSSKTFNPLTYMYYYNGGGVGAGDFNNDGLIDLFFTNNMGKNKLFLNLGDLKFKDVSAEAGIEGGESPDPWWNSGVSVVDINNDGLLDLYVSQVGDFLALKGRNRLYVCQEIKDGKPVFKEDAASYGLDLVGFGTQAAFFDYDGDGDLDMYQLNHSVHANGTFGQKKTFEGTLHPLSGDRLLENQGDRFEDVTPASGIKSTVIGYGLGIAVGDVNLDGWPDLYIGNDFHEDDYLYINQMPLRKPGDKKGAFRDFRAEAIRHTSQFSMGVDIADADNDAWSEIFSLDMLPEDPYILKSSLGEDEYGLYHFKLTYGYLHQFARNTLQRNNADPKGPGDSPGFSELGAFAGVHATDWSWATFFTDFDNDGKKDLFIANGIERRMNDIDYANFRMGDEDLRFKAGSDNLEQHDLSVVEKMPQIKLPNKFFRNQGAFRFADMERQIRGDVPTFSNGAVYADLDNDGDIDIVVSNLEDEPFVYQNLNAENRLPQSDYLSFRLKGAPTNRSAIGTRAIAFKKNGEKITAELFPVRGYQSSAVAPLHLGIGERGEVDSVVVVWPDRSFQTVRDLSFNAVQDLAWKPGLPAFDYNILQKNKGLPPVQFEDVTARARLDFKHVENPFVEFNREQLIPHMVSAEGPAVAVGDADGDGLEDVFFGSSKFERSAMYWQNPDGTFSLRTPQPIVNDSIFEDVDAVFVDLDNDGDLDLAVAAGGNEWRGQEEPMKQRWYRNDGKGHFERLDFPGVYMTASCVRPCDFNNDGLTDLFLGARALPWNYGLTPVSALLLNKGNGRFEDVAEKTGSGLHQAGLVKNAAWADLDGDGDQDLALAIEWEPVTVFVNETSSPEKPKFSRKTLDTRSGWWNFALPLDFDGDGDLDILAGNLGANNKLKPSEENPVRMYVADFDQNGQVEQLLTYYVKGREIPFHNHKEIMKQLPFLKKKYLYARDFAKASPAELVGKKALAEAVKRQITVLESCYYENIGGGRFKARSLPDELQLSSLQAALPLGPGSGVLLGGNFFDCNIEMGRYDASYGHLLRMNGKGGWAVSPLGNVRLDGQVKRIAPIKIGQKTAYIFVRNNDRCVLIEPK